MISTAQAYEWVKTGHWSLRQFREWFDAQQRTWVELTEEDFVCVHQLCDTPIQAAEYVNHLLKEKNA